MAYEHLACRAGNAPRHEGPGKLHIAIYIKALGRSSGSDTYILPVGSTYSQKQAKENSNGFHITTKVKKRNRKQELQGPLYLTFGE